MAKSLKALLKKYKGKQEELIPILQHVQEEHGYLSEEAMLEISKFTRLPESRIYAVATFYAQFRFKPIGKKHIIVCRGTACHVRGAPKILDKIKNELGINEGETTADMEYSLETVACIGCCGLSPCIVINKKVEAKMTPEKISSLFAKNNKKS
ncbi:MAG: NADH-quinone oxidoreductase subunit NuoE [Candidatus Omnitrophota bacterium]